MSYHAIIVNRGLLGMVATFFDSSFRHREAAAGVRRARQIMEAEPMLSVSEALTKAFGIRPGQPSEMSVPAFDALQHVLTQRWDWRVDQALQAAAQHLHACAYGRR
jgi:hypothetical protein